MFVGTGGIWEIAVLSAPFCCEPKSALKIKSIKKKIEKKKQPTLAVGWNVEEGGKTRDRENPPDTVAGI